MAGIPPILAALASLAFAGDSLAQPAASPEVETVSLGQSLIMIVFLAVAALIVVSILSKIVIAAGLVPRKPETLLERLVHRLARIVGTVERKAVRKQMSAGGRGGGGSFGGGGASGDFR